MPHSPYPSVRFQAKLDRVEQEIAEAEFEYLEETDHGNIVKGFEGYAVYLLLIATFQFLALSL